LRDEDLLAEIGSVGTAQMGEDGFADLLCDGLSVTQYLPADQKRKESADWR